MTLVQNMPCGLGLIIVILCIFKNTDQNNILSLLFLKLKQKKNMNTNFFYSYYFKTQKWPFWPPVDKFFFQNLFSVLAFKTIDTQMLFWSIFFLTHQKTVINSQKQPKWRFWRSIILFCAFSKIPNKRTFVRLLFLKLNQSQNTKKTFFLAGFL